MCDPGRYPRDALFLRTRLVSSIHRVTVRSRTAIGAACCDWFLTRVFGEASGASRFGTPLDPPPVGHPTDDTVRAATRIVTPVCVRHTRPGETAPASPAARTSAGTRFWYPPRLFAVAGPSSPPPPRPSAQHLAARASPEVRADDEARPTREDSPAGRWACAYRYPHRRSAAAVVPSAPSPTAVSASERVSTRESYPPVLTPPAKNPPVFHHHHRRRALSPSLPGVLRSSVRTPLSSVRTSRSSRVLRVARAPPRRRVVASRARRPTASFPSRSSRRHSHRARRVPRRRRRRPRTRRRCAGASSVRSLASG